MVKEIQTNSRASQEANSQAVLVQEVRDLHRCVVHLLVPLVISLVVAAETHFQAANETILFLITHSSISDYY